MHTSYSREDWKKLMENLPIEDIPLPQNHSEDDWGLVAYGIDLSPATRLVAFFEFSQGCQYHVVNEGTISHSHIPAEDQNEEPNLKRKFNKLNKDIQILIGQYRSSKWCEACSDINKKQGKNYWDTIKKKLSEYKKSSSIPAIVDNGTLYKTDEEKTHIFKKYVEEAFKEDQNADYDSRNFQSVNEWYDDFFTVNNIPNVGTTVTEEEYYANLNKGKNTSPGFDLISQQGVPQGSPLAPLLYNIYCYDIYSEHEDDFSIERYILLFADDTTRVTHERTLKAILEEYETNNQMVSPVEVKAQPNEIEVNNLQRSKGLTYKNQGTSQRTAAHIYKTLCRPINEYGYLLFRNVSNSTKKKIEMAETCLRA
ncbi:hypothetical protein GEV33_010050 [Tenebrio molitor]|uniref:Reverse transcriptase domain-containing protein n=1 Tax=Tenebrio molitor TaxID=7067 RepID=A0A8J6HEK8_TENMO|nr:hypothetical protein GEV33_010050 [Tenebrio molitor]